jgi:hypothetical protein
VVTNEGDFDSVDGLSVNLYRTLISFMCEPS